jgi:hypothetical protein
MADNKTDIYKTYQQFDLDIVEMYHNYIKTDGKSTESIKCIDDYRSKKSIQGITKNKFLTNIKENSLRGLLKAESTYQESRCHAFYRMMGFPIFDNIDYFNPGFDNSIENIPNQAKKITTEDKLRIISGCINSDFYKLSDARETSELEFQKYFNTNESLNASILTLSSVNLREFAAPLTNINEQTDVLNNVDPSLQEYSVSMFGQVGKYKQNLFKYIGPSGATPTLPNSILTRKHIIYPYLVDPRYSESVNVDMMLAVPFALTKHNYQASSIVRVEAPMIESIITSRLSSNSNAVSTVIQDYLSISDSVNEDLIKTITSNYKATDQQQFVKYLFIIESMMRKLVKAKRIIEQAQMTYYWLPIPSTTGPENGVSIRPIIISKALYEDKTFITSEDYDLIKETVKQFVNNSSASENSTYQNTEIANKPIFGYADVIFSTKNNTACGNENDKTVEALSTKRELLLQEASDALQIIEMIMGEFSGLGLCDILATIASLYIMPIENLLGFLDDDAFERMKYKLNQPSVTKSNLSESIAQLTEKTKAFYNLMDQICKDIDQNNS